MKSRLHRIQYNTYKKQEDLHPMTNSLILFFNIPGSATVATVILCRLWRLCIVSLRILLGETVTLLKCFGRKFRKLSSRLLGRSRFGEAGSCWRGSTEAHWRISARRWIGGVLLLEDVDGATSSDFAFWRHDGLVLWEVGVSIWKYFEEWMDWMKWKLKREGELKNKNRVGNCKVRFWWTGAGIDKSELQICKLQYTTLPISFSFDANLLRLIVKNSQISVLKFGSRRIRSRDKKAHRQTRGSF